MSTKHPKSTAHVDTSGASGATEPAPRGDTILPPGGALDLDVREDDEPTAFSNSPIGGTDPRDARIAALESELAEYRAELARISLDDEHQARGALRPEARSDHYSRRDPELAMVRAGLALEVTALLQLHSALHGANGYKGHYLSLATKRGELLASAAD